MTQQNEYQKSIALWREEEHIAVSWLMRILRKIRQQRQTQSTELELFRDQFEFETGLDSRGDGKQAFESAAWSHIRRAAQHKAGRLANAEKAGGIADFDDLDGPMGDLPSGAEFEAEIIKQQPELKEYRK
jgi:hypothetical protein